MRARSPATLPLAVLMTLTTALPLLAEEVNIYSYRQPDLIAPLTEAFTAETGIKVNVAYLEKGMVERLVAEGDRSPADLVLTVDIARLAEVVEAGVIQPVTSTTLLANVPAAYHDPAGQWWGLTSRARIVYASKDRVQDGEVTTYEDLADPKWKGRICTRPGTHAYNVGLVAAVLHHLGPEATKTWLEGVKANLAKKPEGNDRSQVKSIWAGECDISLGNTYYMAQMLQDPEQTAWADSVRIVFPTFAEGGTHVNISGIAMTKAAPNQASALRMMEWLTSPKAQRIYAETNAEYPVAVGSTPDALVQSWGSFTADDINLMDLAKLRPAALKLIEQVNFDG